MASTVLDPIAVALEQLLDGLAVVPALNVMKWERGDIAPLPAATVHVPLIRRTALDEPESELNLSFDWELAYTVSLYFDLADAEAAQADMVEYVEAFIKTVDANPTLGVAGVDVAVDEAKVVSADPFTERDRKRTLVGYECRVELLAFVAA